MVCGAWLLVVGGAEQQAVCAGRGMLHDVQISDNEIYLLIKYTKSVH
jgi:hypothetical protein